MNTLTTEEKRALLTKLLLKKTHEKLYPLSFAQERLWFIEQLGEASSAYHVHQAYKLTGALDVNALRQSFTNIIERHPVLRTRFVQTKDGIPHQQIMPHSPFVLRVIDLTRFKSERQKQNVDNAISANFRQPFHLQVGDTWRACLYKLTSTEHVLTVVWHHIIFDGHSTAIFWRELTASTTNPVPLRYVDYASWQRQQFESSDQSDALAYWQKQLAKSADLLLQTDFPRKKRPSYAGDLVSFTLQKLLSQQIQQLAHDENISLYMLLLSLFMVLLSRYTNQPDITVGTPIINRPREELENAIGLFVNTLVLRADLGGNPTLQDVIRHVREVVLDGFSFQTFPFAKLVEALSIEGKGGASPPFRILFALNEAASLPKIAGVLTEPYPIVHRTAQFELSLIMEIRGEQLHGMVTYNTDLFTRATIEHMIDVFQVLLQGSKNHLNRPISLLPLINNAQHHQLLNNWNPRITPVSQCVNQIFEAQVQRTPKAIALQSGTTQLTYATLNQRANQVAHLLQKSGVKQETIVGIYFERSLEMIVACLAILKAGGVYLPLELDLPDTRLALILEETNPIFILTQPHLQAHLPINVNVLSINESIIREQPTENLVSSSNADALAYILYTSGSSGRPKGVAVPHRGIVRLVKKVNFVHISVHDRFLQSSPVAFDAATFEIWGALLNGARLIVPPIDRFSLDELGRLITENNITILWLTSGLFSIMVDHQLAALQGVRYLLAGGDVLSVQHVRTVVEHLPATQLINGYGPTENTTFTCCHLVRNDETWHMGVPIGTPISNTQVYILDKQMAPLPVGIVGELYTSGLGLARGYVNRPKLTATAFVPHPFQSGERLYKTGDFARYRTDGMVEFLGRIDHQIKIQGFRVELGEIQVLLTQHSGVREAVAIVNTESSDNKLIIAYVVPAITSPPTPSDLRDFLAQHLPVYMLPAQIIFLSKIPLGRNGKTNRNALPPPTTSQSLQTKQHIPPRNATETRLITLLSTMLTVKKIGVHDNLFDLGGHSLLFMRLKARIFDLFQTDIPLSQFFDRPSVAKLSLYIVQQKVSQAIAQNVDVDQLISEINKHRFDG